MLWKLLAAFLVVVTVIHTADCIKCHNCTSHTSTKCAKIDSGDTSTLIECGKPGAFCRKTVQTLVDSGETRITRHCGFIKFEKYDGDYCMTSNTNFKKELSCQCFTEACNGSNGVKAISALVLIIFAVVIR
ncbi:hypothetical protein Zmor_024675 [Zophobas morio]|uniref:Protein sleepless n=1 Tax=Zophobas morio TaxID=2755281 RepID=A0AA38I2X6_9CUCU|nr:hypothetical protein Zmor_024675 [Zophobas morio]